MSGVQFGITIAACTAATMLTRFLPFLIFSSKDQQPPEVVRYLGRVLPAAIFGMLIVYCLKGVSLTSGSHGIPEAIAIGVTVALHKWKHQTLVSIAGGSTWQLVPRDCHSPRQSGRSSHPVPRLHSSTPSGRQKNIHSTCIHPIPVYHRW